MKLSILLGKELSQDIEFNKLVINSKEVKQGDCFLCIKGISADRHDYIDEAIRNGASCLITQREVDSKVPYVIIKNLDDIYHLLYAKYYNYPQNKLKVIGVTGTDGKTSTTTIIQALIGKERCGYIGTNGYSCALFDRETNNTTPGPESLYKYLDEFVKCGCKYVAMEASSEAFYHHRLKDFYFDSAGLTNIDSEHLNTHKTLENYIDCKKDLFRQDKDCAILNSSDKYFEDFKKLSNKILTYGYREDDDLYIKEYKCLPNKTLITFRYQDLDYDIESPLLGKFNIENLACALLNCLSLGFSFEELKNNIKNIFIPGRMQVIDEGQDYYCIVDFAHTPNGLRSIFEFTSSLSFNRLITVMGQPGSRDAFKRKDVGELLINNSDLAILTADDPRFEDVNKIIDMMLANVSDATNYVRIPDRKEAIAYALNNAKKDDLVLILGKGNERYMKIDDKKIPFFDVEIVKEIINQNKGQD